MMGALLVALFRRQDPMALAGRRAVGLWAVQVLIFSLLPGVSLLAHLGGGLGGAAMMVGLEPSAERKSDRWVSVFFACVLLGVAVRLALVQPERANWNVVRGSSLYDRGQYREAIPYLRRALDEGAGDYRPELLRAALGHSLVETRDIDAGVVELDEAAEIAPDRHLAIAQLARALELEPGDPEHLLTLLREVTVLAASGDLPTTADLAPLVHLPDRPEFGPLVLVRATAAADAGDLGPLDALASSNTWAAKMAAAFRVDGGDGEVPELLRDALLRTPGLFEIPDGGRGAPGAVPPTPPG
jgi:tetratricopeptide (TPR) repeat protein